MQPALRVTAALLLCSAMTGCAAARPGAPREQRPRLLVVAEAHSDVGNDRPQVSFDGLMVRRRVVLAMRLDHLSDVAPMRRELHVAASRSHTTVTTLSAGVLDPLPLQRLAPDLVVALPAGATAADGLRLSNLALRREGWGSMVEASEVLSVLVHDLRFSVRTAHPVALAGAIDAEGILSDALGAYTTARTPGRLDVLYTGPLLSDDLIQSVRVGLARRAHVAPAAVTVAPRSLTGVGVDMAAEPTPAPADDSSPSTHEH